MACEVASPKSVTHGSPWDSSTFSGLRSRCRMAWAWMAAMPRAMPQSSATAACAEIASRWSEIASRSEPSASGSTTRTTGRKHTPNKRTTLGCCTRASTRTSRRTDGAISSVGRVHIYAHALPTCGAARLPVEVRLCVHACMHVHMPPCALMLATTCTCTHTHTHTSRREQLAHHQVVGLELKAAEEFKRTLRRKGWRGGQRLEGQRRAGWRQDGGRKGRGGSAGRRLIGRRAWDSLARRCQRCRGEVELVRKLLTRGDSGAIACGRHGWRRGGRA
mmetsp:Transcript_65190/g.128986  ORF Transcript_65190/g.128986 Transcript_65190/m.128986 type:complete len:276 (-) Transcript_65190:850-1677(-)